MKVSGPQRRVRFVIVGPSGGGLDAFPACFAVLRRGLSGAVIVVTGA